MKCPVGVGVGAAVEVHQDADEHTGYFDFRLPHVVQEALQVGIERALATPQGRHRIEDLGGAEKVLENRKRELVSAIKRITLDFNEPYVFSFSSAPTFDEANDGVLSQWQSYGTDGGYAIVFETTPLEALLLEESKRYQYQFLTFMDAEYYTRLPCHVPVHEETKDMENTIRTIVLATLFDAESHDFEPLFEPINILACSHKHRGFRQEAEVRIVAALTKKHGAIDEDDPDEHRKKKTVHFKPRNGVLEPYIKLFEREANENKADLPICKIIVGPHRDKERRKDAVKMLLNQYAIDAKVEVSEIPYVGR